MPNKRLEPTHRPAPRRHPRLKRTTFGICGDTKSDVPAFKVRERISGEGGRVR